MNDLGVGFTSNILLEVAVPFLFDHVRWRRVPDFVRIKDLIRLDVSHLSHHLRNDDEKTAVILEEKARCTST